MRHRPTDAVFSQNGTALYVVDLGNVSYTTGGLVTTATCSAYLSRYVR